MSDIWLPFIWGAFSTAFALVTFALVRPSKLEERVEDLEDE